MQASPLLFFSFLPPSRCQSVQHREVEMKAQEKYQEFFFSQLAAETPLQNSPVV